MNFSCYFINYKFIKSTGSDSHAVIVCQACDVIERLNTVASVRLQTQLSNPLTLSPTPQLRNPSALQLRIFSFQEIAEQSMQSVKQNQFFRIKNFVTLLHFVFTWFLEANILRISVGRVVELFNRMWNFIELLNELFHLIIFAIIWGCRAHTKVEVKLRQAFLLISNVFHLVHWATRESFELS